jgi:hypothetical protein
VSERLCSYLHCYTVLYYTLHLHRSPYPLGSSAAVANDTVDDEDAIIGDDDLLGPDFEDAVYDDDDTAYSNDSGTPQPSPIKLATVIM